MAILGNTTLTGCNSIPDFIAAGSLMMFQQTASPTSWTKQTTHNNKALRVVSGTAGTGGSQRTRRRPQRSAPDRLPGPARLTDLPPNFNQ